MVNSGEDTSISAWEREHVFFQILFGIGDQYGLQVGQPVAQVGDLALVLHGGGDEDLGVAAHQALEDRLGSKGREERAEYAGVLPCAKCGDVESGDAPGQDGHAVTLAHAKLAQQVGEAVGLLFQVAVGELLYFAARPQPAQGYFIAQGPIGVAVYRFVGDVVAHAVGKPVELFEDHIPAELLVCLGVVQQVGWDFPIGRDFVDRFKLHICLLNKKV